jgi:hypothetical protein
MGLIVSEGEGKSYAPCPVGTHIAICTGVVDLGMHENKYNTAKPQHKVALFWTIPAELREDETPFVVHEIYTATLNKSQTGVPSKLRACLDSWRGKAFTEDELKGFDLMNVLTKPCFVNITHDEREGKVYAKLASVTAMIRNTPIPELPEGTPFYSFDADNPTMEDFNLLPEWVQNMIRKAQNWDDIFGKLNANSSIADDAELPF